MENVIKAPKGIKLITPFDNTQEIPDNSKEHPFLPNQEGKPGSTTPEKSDRNLAEGPLK